MALQILTIPRLPQMGRSKPSGKPKIRWGDPITRRLVWCVPFYEGFNDNGGSGEPLYRDLVGGPIGSLRRMAAGTLAWTKGPPGLAVQPSGTSNPWAKLDRDPFGTGILPDLRRGFTFMAVFRHPAGTGSSEGLFSLRYRFSFAGLEAATDSLGQGLLSVNLTGSTGLTKSASYYVAPDQDVVLIATRQDGKTNVNDPAFRVWCNGGSDGPSTGNLAILQEAEILRLNAVWDSAFEVEANPGRARWYLAAMWRRQFSEQEAWRLTADPFLIIRPEEEDLLGWRELPCFDFDNRRVFLRPVEQTDPSGVVLAAKANRIEGERLEIRLSALDPDELDALEAAWDGGRGAVDPFYMVPPGDTQLHRYIFETDRLEISHDTSKARSARVILRDVTRHGNP